MPFLSECGCGTGADNPQRSPGDPSPQTGALQPHPQSLLGPLLWLREADRRRLPSCRHPRGHDLGRPSAPGSGRLLAFRPVPELSSPGTSQRRLEAASSSGQQWRPPPYLSFRRRSAVSCAGVSSSHQSPQLTTKETCDRPGQNTERHATLANPSGRPPPRGTLGDVVPIPGGVAAPAAWISRYRAGVGCGA